MTDSAPSEDPWVRLGRLLVDRRVELGHPKRLSWTRDVLGLTHDRTQSDLENARRSNYDTATLAQVEQQYRWAPGSIRDVLAGGDPSPFNGPGLRYVAPANEIEESNELIEMLEMQLRELDAQYYSVVAQRTAIQAQIARARLELYERTSRKQRAVQPWTAEDAEDFVSGPQRSLDVAARDTGTSKPSRGQQRRLDADQAGDPPDDDRDDMEPR